ncbi:MAG: type II secretion system F family protein [Ruminococcus albus]|uniref:Type II secretion system protein F domain protein n=2 Tax=Ruminococcus albus TaxID=1264 RepID=E9SAK1_RUMAL|nr:type II secretion system F family protein [Ruminococcus albus]EGC03652.1 type II secretion system protein F domain protein [Ruminococcus albus 8]MBE6872342.1 type II secretion system F family protein [Ruminococcus albus]
MKNYSYVAKDTTGKTIKGTYEAENEQELLDKIYEQGLFCVSYNEALGGGKKTAHKFKTAELAYCCRQLSAMMSSGLTIVKALDILYKEEENKGAKAVWRDVYEDVQKGESFSGALEAKRGCFPDFFISMVDAGEISGSLDVTMKRLQEYYANSNKLNNKVKGAMIYPCVLLVLVIVLVLAMSVFILPIFRSMMPEDNLNVLQKALFGFSDFVIKKWYALLIGVVVLVLAWTYAMKVESVKLKFDYMKIKMPLVGPLMVKIAEGRFSRTLSSLYSSGIPMVDCLERSSRILNNTYIDKMFLQVVDEVKQGSPVSTALSKTEIFEGMFCSIIYVGEESGALDDILEKTADFYEEEADAAVTRLVGLMEPLMIIILGVGIGLVLAAIFPMLYGGIAEMEKE